MRGAVGWARRIFLSLWVVGSSAVVRAQQSWDFYYILGMKQLRDGNARGAVESLQHALRLGPPPGPRRPTPGGTFVNFFPYLYLAKAYLTLGDCEQARRMIEASVEKDGIPPEHLDSALQTTTRQDVQKACGPPPALTRPEPEPPPPPPTRPAVPVEVVRQAVRLYRQGAYREVVRFLTERQREYELDDTAYFLWGCSLAARYFWEGQRDKRLLQEARAYFQKVHRLPPTFEQVLPDLVSPKVRDVYTTARPAPP